MSKKNKVNFLHFNSVPSNIADYIQRAKVPMGWLVEASTNVSHMMYQAQYGGNGPDGYDWRVAITFVFDPFHLWK